MRLGLSVRIGPRVRSPATIARTPSSVRSNKRPIRIDAKMRSFNGLIAVDNAHMSAEQVSPFEPGIAIKLAA